MTINKKNIIMITIMLLFSLLMIGSVSAATNTHITHTDTIMDKTNNNNYDIITENKEATKLKSLNNNNNITNLKKTKPKNQKNNNSNSDSDILTKKNTDTNKLKGNNVDSWDGLNTAINKNEGYITLNQTITKTGSTIDIGNGKTVTINGNGHTIDAQENGQIFNVYNGATLILENLKLINAKNSPTGGAIYNTGTLTVTNSTFNNNQARGVGLGGGAIYNDYGNLTISNSQFTHNTATDYGGAIYNAYGNLIISNSQFTHNTATNKGGAIFTTTNSYNSGSTDVFVTGSLFVDNTANNFGSAIYGYSFDILTVNHNIFLNNTGTNIIYLNKDDPNSGFKYDLDCNWFGNNATDYNITTSKPKVASNEGDLKYNWLFLNATTTSDSVTVFSTSNITFKLYLYNSTNTGNEVSIYDNKQLYPINLNITALKGSVDKKIAHLNETIKYNATTAGTGSVTAKAGNMEYSVNLINKKIEQNTQIIDITSDLFEDKPCIISGRLISKGKGLSNQKIILNITNTKGYKGTFTGETDANGKFSIKVKLGVIGPVTILTIYNGNITDNYIYKQSSNSISSNVQKVVYNIKLDTLQTSYDYQTRVNITGQITSNYQPLDIKNINITINGVRKTVNLNSTGGFKYTSPYTTSGLYKVLINCSGTIKNTKYFIKYPTHFTITKIPNTNNNKAITITITESNKFTGTVNVKIGKKVYKVQLKNGKGTQKIKINTLGTYIASITFPGNNKYTKTNAKSNKFTIKYPTRFTISKIPNIKIGSKIKLTIKEQNKYTGPVKVTIGSKKYTIKLKKGLAKKTIALKLAPGKYVAKILFNGNTKYSPAKAVSNKFKINK